MKFLRGLLKFLAVVLAIILSITLMVTEISLMALQSASFIMTKDVIQELIQSVDISKLVGKEDNGEQVIYVPETHHLDAPGSKPTGTGEESTEDSQKNVIENMVNSFVETFEKMPEAEQQEMQASLEEIDINAIVEGLSGKPIPEGASDEEVEELIYASVTGLDTVQELLAEVSANAVDKLVNETDKDVITPEALNSLISNVTAEIKEKTGVKLPEKFVSMASDVIQENSEVLAEDINSMMDEEAIQSMIGDSADSQQIADMIKMAKMVLSVRTRLILLAAVVLLGVLIFLLFLRSKAGLIWDAVVTIISSTIILTVGIGLNMGSALLSMVDQGMEESMKNVLDGVMPVLGKQFIKAAIIGYVVAVLLIAVYVIIRVVKSKKAAKAALLAAVAEAETTAQTEETVEAEDAAEPEESVETDEAFVAEESVETEETAEPEETAEAEESAETEETAETEEDSDTPLEV